MKKNIIQGIMKGIVCTAVATVITLAGGERIPVVRNIVNTTTVQAATSVSELKQQFPSGSKWNLSYKNKAWQCHGFACLIADKLTDTDPYNWSKVNNFNSLKPGDIIRFSKPHSILVTGVSGNMVTYVDCNWVSSNTVKWDQTIQKSRLTTKFGRLSAVWVSPKNINSGAANGAGGVAPAVNNTVPVIHSVKINGIDRESINFSFSVNNATLAKIVIESTLTGAQKVIEYTSGLSNINYTFARYDIPTGGNQYHIYLYAYNGNAGNYKNEQVHKMLYGSTANCVTFPDTLNNNQIKQLVFNKTMYADLNDDIKKVYGYDEDKLWMHYLLYGVKEGRVTPVFWPSYYLKNSGDLNGAYGTKNYERAFYHFTTYGYAENRKTSPIFTASYYLSKNADISKAYGKNNYYQATVHFNTYGIYEFRNSSEYYWVSYYKNNNGDLNSLNMSSYDLVKHYLQWGLQEKRIANAGKKYPNV